MNDLGLMLLPEGEEILSRLDLLDELVNQLRLSYAQLNHQTEPVKYGYRGLTGAMSKLIDEIRDNVYVRLGPDGNPENLAPLLIYYNALMVLIENQTKQALMEVEIIINNR